MTNLNALREAVAESPQNIPLRLLYAHSCLDELSLTDASEAFERVLDLNPDNAEAKLGIARVLFLHGKTSEAAVRAQRVLQEQPYFAPAHIFLSRLYLGEENLEQAAEHYRRAVVINKAVSDPGLEKSLASFLRKRPGAEGGGDDRVRLPMTMERGWHPRGDEGPRGPDDYDEETPSLFDDLEGYDEGEETPPLPFGLQDFRRPLTRFADAGGMEDLKEAIRLKIVYPLQHPDLFRAYGKGAGGSILLYGPPGCGKTLISRAIAGETPASFFEIGLHQVLEMYFGSSEKNLHQIFELAREHAPAVVFIDELDGFAAARMDLRQNFGRTLIHQLLHELDENGGSNRGVFVVGATSAPWDLDAAFFRPGRFDQSIKVDLPNGTTRRAVLEILTRDKPATSLDFAPVVRETRDFSGADLKALVDLATEEALGRAMELDRIVPLTTQSLLQAAKRVRPSGTGWERHFREKGLGR